MLDAALDYAASGIRINAVCPGVIDTAMIARLVDNDPDRRAAFESQEPVGRLGTVDEIAKDVDGAEVQSSRRSSVARSRLTRDDAASEVIAAATRTDTTMVAVAPIGMW